MLSARAIYCLLIDDEQPVLPPDDPNRLELKSDQDDLLDPTKELARYSEQPLLLRGTGPTTTYQFLQTALSRHSTRQHRDLNGHRRVKLKDYRNTFLIVYPDRLAVRYYDTDVVIAYPDGKVVFETGGWHPGGGQSFQWGYNVKEASGVSTMSRIDYIGASAGGWQIYRKDHVWYWFNRGTTKGTYQDEVRYAFTPGDIVHPDGSLQIQEVPTYIRRRKPKV